MRLCVANGESLVISRKVSDQRERIGGGRAVARIWLWPPATLRNLRFKTKQEKKRNADFGD